MGMILPCILAAGRREMAYNISGTTESSELVSWYCCNVFITTLHQQRKMLACSETSLCNNSVALCDFTWWLSSSPAFNPQMVSMVSAACLSREIMFSDWPCICWEQPAESPFRSNIMYPGSLLIQQNRLVSLVMRDLNSSSRRWEKTPSHYVPKFLW